MAMELGIGILVLILSVSGIGFGSVWYVRKRLKGESPPKLVDARSVHEVFSVGDKAYVMRIIALSLKVKKKDVKELVSDIGFIMGKIFENLAKDPRDIGAARNFVEYHAPKCVELVEEYVRVEGGPASSSRDTALLQCVDTLVEIKDTVDAFYKKCLENDVAGLEILSETLRRIGRIERPVVFS